MDRGRSGPQSDLPTRQLSATSKDLTDTEHALANIWRRMFGISSVARDDSFFALGGDSITAVQMIGEAEGLFDLVLPSFLVFEAPTLGELCEHIDRAREQLDGESSRGCIFPLVPSGSGAPMFVVGIDLALPRRDLWTVPCPVFAIANWAAGSRFASARSLEDLAAGYLDGVRRIQPNGPYRLGGYSLGALVALEMAQQLRTAGEEVDALFLLDPTFRSGTGAQARDQPPALTNGTFELLFPHDRQGAFWLASLRLWKGYTARPYDGRALAVFSRTGDRPNDWSALLRPDAPLHVLDVPPRALFEPPALGEWMGWMSEIVR